MEKLIKKVPKNIDEYLSGIPEPARSALQKLRQTIKSVAPKAEEVISYGMPAFKYYGMLVYFAAFKEHCSFFPGSANVSQFKDELKGFKTSKGTIQFTVEKPLSVSLIKKIVKQRIKENEEKAKKKK